LEIVKHLGSSRKTLRPT